MQRTAVSAGGHIKVHARRLTLNIKKYILKRERGKGKDMELKEHIAQLLCEDAKYTNKEIATMVGADEKKVSDAIAEMEKDGVILKYVALINDRKLKRDRVEAIIELKVAPERELGYEDIAKRVHRFNEVKAVYLVSGDYDLHVKVEAESMQAISKFVWEKLAVLQGITSTATLFSMKKYKDKGVSMVGEDVVQRLVVSP